MRFAAARPARGSSPDTDQTEAGLRPWEAPARRTPGHTARPPGQHAHLSRRAVRAQPSCLTARCPARGPCLRKDPEAFTVMSARESPGVCETQPGPTQACAVRGAAEAAARSRSDSGPDDRRSWGRSAHTRRCSRPRHGRPRCGPAVSARWPCCRGRADRRAGVPQPPQARCAATSQGPHGDAVRRQRPDGQPVRYPPHRRSRKDWSLNSPPGSSFLPLPGSGAVTLLSPDGTLRPRKNIPSRGA